MKLTRSLLKRLINEEIKTVSERKLPPREDPDIVARWQEVAPALDQLAELFRESPTGPHYTMAEAIENFKNKVDAGMKFASYGERERIETVGHRPAEGEISPPQWPTLSPGGGPLGENRAPMVEGVLDDEPYGSHTPEGLSPEQRNIFMKAFDRWERLKRDLDQATREMIDSLKPGPEDEESV